MARIVKRKKQKSKFEVLSIILFFVAGAVWLFSNLFLRTINIGLSVEIQQKQRQINELKESNANLRVEINQLQNRNRVYEIAVDAGLKQNQENVIVIKNPKK